MPETLIPVASVAGRTPRPSARVYRSVALVSYLAREYHMAPYGAAVLANAIEDDERRRRCDPMTDVEVIALDHATPAEQAAAEVLARDPALIGLSLYVWNYSRTLALASALRRARPDAVIVVGGPHVSRDDARLTRAVADGIVDCCIAGEGEGAFLRILGQPKDELPAFVDGDPALFSARTSPYLSQPVLRRELDATKTVIIEGSRGCPFLCTFCDQGWRKARLADDAPLRDELKALYDLGARHFIFLDPTFNYHRSRMHDVLGFMREELPGATFSAELKVEMLKDDDVAALDGLCTHIEAGLQTVHPETQRVIRRRENVDRLWENTNALLGTGIKVAVNTIYGLPGESLADWLATVDAAYAATRAQITSTCLKVLPNTEIWNQRQTFGYLWDEDDLFRALESDAMSGAEFRRAEALSRVLSAVQTPDGVVPEVRLFLADRPGWKLSDFLVAMVDGRIVLRSGTDRAGARRLRLEMAGEAAAA
ncbi:radical SAM protein [Micromonospora sp. WMMD882]|uniref:B12-binding domain-containing radical SAM protein n=1 Tax=Micromonospora sp. WMMD882 TaxID=3015151 RepID=UPI00248CED4B|nr:radical SAM protein [Micromonospora sp. WMMD882]WBB80238.1 radical SAM protein [Micromonospora sp. WMMD882]